MRRVDRRTNALQTDRPTDQPTDTASYRGALSHLKSWSQSSAYGEVEELIQLIWASNEIYGVSKFDNSFIWRQVEFSMTNIFQEFLKIFFYENLDFFFIFNDIV